jgi:hypothetical protein
MHDCDVLRSRFLGRGNVDTELIRNDLTFLIEQAQQLQRENDALLPKRDSLLGLSSPNSSTRNDLPEKQSYWGLSPPTGPPAATIVPPIHAIPDSDSPGASGGAGAPPDPPNPYSWNRHYGEHTITKIDQIAYIPNPALAVLNRPRIRNESQHL